MYAETESFVYDLADYLIVSSDDIWQTLDFFDEIKKSLKNAEWK